jgi:hypothetical protein
VGRPFHHGGARTGAAAPLSALPLSRPPTCIQPIARSPCDDASRAARVVSSACRRAPGARTRSRTTGATTRGAAPRHSARLARLCANSGELCLTLLDVPRQLCPPYASSISRSPALAFLAAAALPTLCSVHLSLPGVGVPCRGSAARRVAPARAPPSRAVLSDCWSDPAGTADAAAAQEHAGAVRAWCAGQRAPRRLRAPRPRGPRGARPGGAATQQPRPAKAYEH